MSSSEDDGFVMDEPEEQPVPPRGALAPDALRLLDHAPDGITVHQDGRFVFFNAVAARWLGARSSDELVGHAVSRFVHVRSLPLLMARTATLHRPGDVAATTRTTVVRLDDTELHVDAVSALTTWRGAPAYQLIFRDPVAHRASHDAVAHRAGLVDHSGDALISITRAGMVTSWNPAAERIYRRPAHHALAGPVAVAVGAPVDVAAIAEAGGVVHATHYAMDGSIRAIRISMTSYDDGYVLSCSDETTHRRAARNLRTVVNSLPEGIVVVDRDRALLTINPAARRMLGFRVTDRTADIRDRLRDLVVYDATGTLLAPADRPVQKTFTTRLPIIGQIFGIDRPDGRRIWLSASCQLLRPDERGHSPVLVSFTDVTSQRAAAEHLAHRAAHDVLTGLPNRAHILDTVNAIRRRAGLLTAVLFIDLDDLKTVNDSLGHDAGDTVIRATAHRLRRAVRRRDVVGRLAGDEFVALLVGPLERTDLHRFVDRMQHILTAPIRLPGGSVQLGASIGVVQTHPADKRDAATLLRDADAAMYAAKARGRQTITYSKLSPSQG